jgi:NAD(P)-dependent dehydrogenase (short-subunit alcohol dehydrogenase family)
VNLVGVWNTCRASIPHLKAGERGGAMVLTSSTAGLVGGHYGWSSGTVGYCAAKHGVVGIMRTLANALAPESIRVNSIHPTGVNTAMISNPIMLEWLRNSVDAGASALGNPLPVDVLEPEDISNTVAFLASDEARYITGVTLPVDAGFCNK